MSSSDSELELECDADFEETIKQLETICNTHTDILQRLEQLQMDDDAPSELETRLEQLHAESLIEISKTGKSSFGKKLIAELS